MRGRNEMHSQKIILSQTVKNLIFAVAALCLVFSGCGEAGQTDAGAAYGGSEAAAESSVTQSDETAGEAAESSVTQSDETADAADESSGTQTAGTADGSSEENGRTGSLSENDDTSAEAITLETIPEYSGSPYVAINGNVPFFTEDELTTEAFESYSELDSLGRCGVAFANICREIMPTEPRGSIGSVKPVGWHTVKYEIVDGNYLYNRCHLIAYELAGENANEKNLITGTRYLNVEGMLPFENMVADYVEETGSHVLYRVTPMFEGDNLVADGALMEAMSVEDDGAGILFCVYCYNVQPGIAIDYATGDSWETGEGADAQTGSQNSGTSQTDADQSATDQTSSSASGQAGVSADESGEAEIHTYILNTNTKKFHYPDCSSVSKMKDENKKEFTGTRDEAISQGYDPCGNCRP
ncbi:MAG: DNA/RNA non-specific endonuclease [Lachnospiraceae bacterium]|nr:DNA/RNA non-specific endonuclease [Lachnospiraceae bacterium]